MDFYSALKSCYKDGINSFLLHSLMSDLCKGDLEFKGKLDCLYKICKQRDIFNEISRCDKSEFDVIIEQSEVKLHGVLIDIAMLFHSDWQLSLKAKPCSNKKIKVQKATVKQSERLKRTPLINRQVVNLQARNLLPKQNANNKVQKPKFKAKEIRINSLLTDLDVITSSACSKIEIHVLEKGKWSFKTDGILRRPSCIFVNIETVVADKVEVYVPKDKYSRLEVNKSHGNLTVTDNENCFEEVVVNLNSGELNCKSSARIVNLCCWVGKVSLNYSSTKDGSIEICNTLGGVDVLLDYVKKVDCKAFSAYGNVINSYKGVIGNDAVVKIRSKYGDINVA